MRVAERLRAALQKPFDVDGQQVFMSATRRHRRQHDRLRRGRRSPARRGDRAASREGRAARRRCELFDPAMRDRAVSRLQMETDLRQAIEREAFEVHYQPIVALDERPHRRLRGAGALAASASAGLVSPAEFIPRRRRHRHDRADRPPGPGRVVPADGDVAAAVRRGGAARHVRQRVEPAVRATSIWRARSKRCCGDRAWSRRG